ncbi:PREDICTED: protein kinase C eta type-like [Acropora digitifera]|uniref:protein kinase C eta type-like n=1 Tax=Acropora digitifera TaxID=70779 RepID=UPI00077AC632|nr:PREDICTED: protein kinase C eta type-like [Acropora digitifera]
MEGDPLGKLCRTAENFWKASLANLELIRELGKGGFGTVWLFKNRQTGQDFAIKMQGKENKEIFLNEACMLQAVQGSSFVTKLCCLFATKEFLCMVLEFLPGGDLEKLLTRHGKLEESAVRFYGCEIICAMEYIHQRRIIHRDLKLDNTLINANGHVKVGDFGLSKLTNGEKQDEICGTLHYMAPEMIGEQSYDESVDWWALGVMLYRLFTAKFFSKVCPEISEMIDSILASMEISSPATFPFDAVEEQHLKLAILGSRLVIPQFLSPNAQRCVAKFLQRTPQLRLGYQSGDFQSAMDEPFFSDVEWVKVLNQEVDPPFALIEDRFTINTNKFIVPKNSVGNLFVREPNIYVSLSSSESTSDGKKSADKERAATVIQSAWRRYKNRAIQKLEKAASIIHAAWWTYKVNKMRKVVMEVR